jgi:hypothetical protein
MVFFSRVGRWGKSNVYNAFLIAFFNNKYIKMPLKNAKQLGNLNFDLKVIVKTSI